MPTIDKLTTEVLRQAMEALRSRNSERARDIAEAALRDGGDRVALSAFLGMLCARDGDLAGSIPHLEAAHQGRPEDITIACNLISAQIDIGNLSGALAVATPEMALADRSFRIARYRGYLAQTLGQFDDAVEVYEYIVADAPDDFESWNNLGNARLSAGSAAGGVSALERAVALDPRAPPARINLATALLAAGRAAEAEVILRATISDFPDDSRAPHELYTLLKNNSRDREALPFLEDAVRLDPDSARLQFKLAVEYGAAMRTIESERAYWFAIELDPQLSDGYLGLGIQYEHSNREDDLQTLIVHGEAARLDQSAMAFLRALQHRRAGRFTEALECLALVPATMEPERVSHIRATLLDRLGQSAAAFAAFEETARLQQADPSNPLARAQEARDELAREIALLTPTWRDSWRCGTLASDRPDPVFLVGFPRSGTTLLDTILMGHPQTNVLEEQPYLNRIEKMLGGLAMLPDLGDADIADARARYFAAVEEAEGPAIAPVLIDKSPLFLQKVPLIHRLFPTARFILALRHPCDVLLSCYMSNFRLNSAMSNFLRLEDAADYYDLTFQHWQQSQTLFPGSIHTVVYERLIADVEAEVRPLFDFLGLDFDQRALDHQHTAKARGLITTASYSQVAEPIYARANGRWTRYRDKLEPVLATLAPWVQRFGYKL